MTSPTKKTDTASSSSSTSDKAEAKSSQDAKTTDTRATASEKREEQTDFARLGVNADVSDFVEYGGYREEDSENFTPNPHFQYGTLDTSDTAGAAHQNIKEVSPVFEVGRAQALQLAARALDPEDKDVSESLVVLPEESLTADEAKRNLADRVQAYKDEPIVVGGMTAEQRAAATDADGNVAEAPKGEDAAEKKTSDKK
jgi:hypothetical protein